MLDNNTLNKQSIKSTRSFKEISEDPSNQTVKWWTILSDIWGNDGLDASAQIISAMITDKLEKHWIYSIN